MKVVPSTTVPAGTRVEIHAISAAVIGRASSIDVVPLQHLWNGPPSLETRTGPNGTTIAVFTPAKPGRYVVSLSSGERGKSDATVIDVIPPLPIDYWRSIGPRNLPPDDDNKHGHVNALAIAHIDKALPLILYAGAASGGVWKNDGGGWRPLTDNQLFRGGTGTMGIGALVVDQQRPDIVYAGTGQPNQNASGAALGVFRSRDGGVSWEPTGNSTLCENSEIARLTINRLAIHPTNSDIVWAGTSNGLFRTVDGGDCWTKEGSTGTPGFGTVPAGGQVTDVAVDSGNPDTVYVAFQASGIYKRTVNAAASPSAVTWTKLSIPAKLLGRIRVVVAASKSDVLYATFAPGDQTFQMFRSEDAGVTWKETAARNGCYNNQCFGHDDVLAVDPANPNRVFIGHVPIFRSDDGGKTWSDISGPTTGDKVLPVKGSNVHGDNQALVFDPLDASVIYLADDGGVARGTLGSDGVLTWEYFNKDLVIGQFGSVSTSPAYSSVITGGAWHNANVRTEDGGTTYKAFGGGDGYDTRIDADKPTIVFFDANAGANGDVARYDAVTGSITPIFASGWSKAWTDPFFGGDLLMLNIGTEQLFRVRDARESTPTITNISPPSGNGNLTSLAFPRRVDPGSRPAYIVGTDKGTLFAGRENFSGKIDWVPVLSGSRAVIGVAADPNSGRLFALLSGVSPGRVEVCTSRGTIWTCEIVDSWPEPSSLQPPMYRDIVVDPLAATDTFYIASDQGIYRYWRDDSGWKFASSPGMPRNADVRDLDLQESNALFESGVIRAATYGRGLWELVRFEKILTDDLSWVQPVGSEWANHLLAIAVPYTVHASAATIRATVLAGGVPAQGFSTTTARVTQPSGIATLLVGYFDRTAPLSMRTDDIRIEITPDGQSPTSRTYLLHRLWTQSHSRTLHVDSQRTGIEGGSYSLSNAILVTSGGSTTTLTTPFDLVLPADTHLSLRAPATAIDRGRAIPFGNWVIGGEAVSGPDVSLVLSESRDIYAGYQSAEADIEPPRTNVSANIGIHSICAADASHEIVISWTAGALFGPAVVKLTIYSASGRIEAVDSLPAQGQRILRMLAPSGDTLHVLVEVSDVRGVRSAVERVVTLIRCAAFAPPPPVEAVPVLSPAVLVLLVVLLATATAIRLAR